MAEIGRPKKIKTPEDMHNLFQSYKKWAKENPILKEDYVGKDAHRVLRQLERPLTMEGFENHCSSFEDGPLSIDQYFSNKDGGYHEFVGICRAIRSQIREDQITGGMAGIYNPSITQRLNGLTERTESKVIVEQPLFGEDE